MKQHLIFFAIIAACILSSFSYSAPLKAANIMQCMIDCIKQEGETAKAICKLRCANITLPLANAGSQPDCMSIFKKCKNICDKSNKVCWQSCKEALIGCK